MRVMFVYPHRAARAFGEYLSHTHPENRNGSGQRLCQPAICPSLYSDSVCSIDVLILPPNCFTSSSTEMPGCPHWRAATTADNQTEMMMLLYLVCHAIF